MRHAAHLAGGLLAVLVLTACGGSSLLYPTSPIEAAELDPNHAVFSAPSMGVSFEYPHQWTLQADRRDQGRSALLTLRFSTGSTNSRGEREVGEMVLRRQPIETGTLLEDWVRENLRDSRRQLEFSACRFPSRALECLEISNQDRWLAAGRTAPEFTVYLKAPGWIYSAAWGERDTFDFRGTGGVLILQSLRYGEK